jgi:sugar fermentation stimulation protein A
VLLPQPIARGRLISRYKRFFADVELDSGEIITAHCANTGSMLGLKEPGQIVWVSKAANPKRTLGWDLQMVQLPTGLVGINTGHPNRIVGEAIAEKAIAPLAHYSACRPEVKYGENSRIDFLLTGDGLPDCYVEVKNVHFSRTIGLAEFPDSRTERGAKHLAEMANMVRAGHRAVMLYLVQRDDCTRMGLCADLDPAYAEAFALAKIAGVEALAYACTLSTSEIRLGQALPI